MKKNRILALLLSAAVAAAAGGQLRRRTSGIFQHRRLQRNHFQRIRLYRNNGDKVKLEFFYQKNDTPQIMAIVDAFHASGIKSRWNWAWFPPTPADRSSRPVWPPTTLWIFCSTGLLRWSSAWPAQKPDRGFDRGGLDRQPVRQL